MDGSLQCRCVTGTELHLFEVKFPIRMLSQWHIFEDRLLYQL